LSVQKYKFILNQQKKDVVIQKKASGGNPPEA